MEPAFKLFNAVSFDLILNHGGPIDLLDIIRHQPSESPLGAVHGSPSLCISTAS